MTPDYSKLQPFKIKSREELIKQVRTYIGVPFRHRGRDRHGVDCGGLIIAALRDLGYDPPDFTIYGREPARDGLKQYLDHAIGLGASAKVRSPIPGDVVLMSFNQGGTPQHVGILARHPASKSGALSIIHAYGEIGHVIEHGFDQTWRRRTRYIYRFELDTACNTCTGFSSTTPPPTLDDKSLT